MNGIDYRNQKASKIAAKNAEMLKQAEYKKIQEVQRGVALLRDMREKQEKIRIQQQMALNQRLENEIVKPKKPQVSRNNQQVTSKTVVDVPKNNTKASNRYGEAADGGGKQKRQRSEYSLIEENPSGEDRESFPLEEKPKKKMNIKSLADEE